jgi:hypothetical protein
VSIDPPEPVAVQWRQGGEGLGGAVRRGRFAAVSGAEQLQLGEWSAPLTLGSVLPGEVAHDTYFTISAGTRGKPIAKGSSQLVGFSHNAVFELEHSHDGKVLRTLRATSPEGATITLVVPGSRRDGYVDRLATVAEVAGLRQQRLRQLPWFSQPLPHRYSIVSDLGGYGEAWGYGVRSSDASVVRVELDNLLQLGVTGLRAAPDFVVRAGPAAGGKWHARLVGPVGYPVPRIRKDRDTEHEAGCPFGKQVGELQQQGIEKALERARAANGEEAWVLTVDEIGAVTDLADNGKEHLTTCERCRKGFVDYLKSEGLTPERLGAKKWDDVRPLSIWKGPQTWVGDRGLSRRAYYTRKFLNVASASLFTPLRDELARVNKDASATQPKIYSYALRGNNFLSNGSSLDYFEFYRHADNAFVWETSNRDARAWPWDSYLTDVQRVLKRELGVETGIYIKPHRGAPVQRMLSALSRGDGMLYWYTYGPDYWKGDSFSAEPKALDLTSKAAHLLGAAETSLFGSTLAAAPRVAIVRPETTWAWTALSKDNLPQAAALENGKWIYTALQHEHIAVDPLDERFLQELDLSRYAAIYVTGTHIETTAAIALANYVQKGGRLITSGFGLARDESNAPLASLWPVFGVVARSAPEMWCTVPPYRAGQLGSITQLPASEPPTPCAARDALHGASSAVDLPLMVGREVLKPRTASDVVATFADGSPAVVKHVYGAGEAWLFGAFVGVEYATPVLHAGFDMRRDFEPGRRAWVVGPLTDNAALTCSDPLVEAVLLKTADGAGHALTLINWAYRDQASHPEAAGLVKFVQLAPARDVQVTVPSLSSVKRVRSLELRRELPFQNTPAGVTFVVPRLEEGDVIAIQ